jgi:hypothetical protein
MKSKKSNKDLKKNESKNHTATKNNSGTTKVRQRQNKTKSLEGEQTKIVIKRSSGRKEKFDTNRMAQTVSRSGVPFVMAIDVAKKVSTKIKKEGSYNQKSKTNDSDKPSSRESKGKTVTGSGLRNIVANELHGRNRSDIAAF